VDTPSLEIPRRALEFRDERGGFSLILKRNSSMTPASLGCVFVALALAALAIGAGFAAAGAWLVLPFAGLEALLLGAAFVMHARHAGDYERIELVNGGLTVEVAEGERVTRHELHPPRLRVFLEEGRVLLRGPQEELEVGRSLDAEARVRLAAGLERRLRI
jgi:uncharacterized membrane protein